MGGTPYVLGFVAVASLLGGMGLAGYVIWRLCRMMESRRQGAERQLGEALGAALRQLGRGNEALADFAIRRPLLFVDRDPEGVVRGLEKVEGKARPLGDNGQLALADRMRVPPLVPPPQPLTDLGGILDGEGLETETYE